MIKGTDNNMLKNTLLNTNPCSHLGLVRVMSMALLSASILVSTPLLAYERSHDAHEHGHAQLTIAQEGNELELMFVSPADDIVGFEYAPKTESERTTVLTAKSVLEAAEALYRFTSDASCSLEKAEVESGLLADAKHGHKDKHDDHHDDHGHDDHGHKDKHGDHHDDNGHDDHGHKDKHDDHHDDHGHDDHGYKEAHSEFEAHYHFECDKIAALKSVELSLFSVFPSLQEVDVQYVVQGKQGVKEANPKDRVVEF